MKKSITALSLVAGMAFVGASSASAQGFEYVGCDSTNKVRQVLNDNYNVSAKAAPVITTDVVVTSGNSTKAATLESFINDKNRSTRVLRYNDSDISCILKN